MTLRAAVVPAGLLLICSCVKAPALRPPAVVPDVPEEWSAPVEASAAPDGTWWEVFEDPALNRLVEEAFAGNPDLRVAAARVDRAAADARIAGADLKPSAGLSAGSSRRRQNFIGFPIPGGERSVLSATSTSYGVALETFWEVDLWGRLRSSARAAVADLQAASADLHAARLSLAGQVCKAWFALIEARAQLALAEETARSWNATADQVRTRYESGLRSPLDLRLSLSNAESAGALRELRRQQLDSAVRQIEILLGRYPAGTLEPTPALPTPAPEIPGGLPADLVFRRPDLLAAERRFAASEARLAAARRSLYPRLSLTASGGTVSDQLRDLLDGDFRVWSFLSNLTQPLFQGGRLRAGVDRAGAGSEAAAAAYAGAVLRALTEVESSLAAESFLARRVEHQSRAAAQAAAARRLAEERYRSGLADTITVLEAQRRALAAESQLLTDHRLRLTNRVDLTLALGGGFRAPDTLDPGRGASAPAGEFSSNRSLR